jgi:hypothetical protein
MSAKGLGEVGCLISDWTGCSYPTVMLTTARSSSKISMESVICLARCPWSPITPGSAFASCDRRVIPTRVVRFFHANVDVVEKLLDSVRVDQIVAFMTEYPSRCRVNSCTQRNSPCERRSVDLPKAQEDDLSAQWSRIHVF